MKSDRSRTLLALLLIASATVLCYSSVYTFDFNDYDDVLYVTGNDLVKRGITAEGVTRAFTGPMAANWHPLTMISHMLDVELFGLRAGAHHVVNAVFHLANSLLLFWVLLIMTHNLWPSVAVALVFAVHPLHVESVAWVAERKDVLSGFFAMLALWAYARYAASGRWLDYALVLLFFTAGLLSKPMLVTLPVLLLLLDYWPLGRFRFSPNAAEWFPSRSLRRVVLEKVPLLLLAFGASVATIIAQRQVHAVAPLDHFPLAARLFNAVISYVRYLAKTFWPTDLSFHYTHPGFWPWPMAVAAMVLLLIFSCGAFVFARRFPWLPVGWLWFLVSLIPVIGIVQVGGQAMADRYMYLPIIGLALIAAWTLERLVGQRTDLRWPVTAAGSLGIIALGVVTYIQSQHWRDSERLYSHGLRLDWNNTTAHRLLARTLSQRGDHVGAVRHYLEALRLLPRDELLHYNLGIVLTQTGEILKARDHFATSLQLNPTNSSTRFHLGRTFSLLGDAMAAESNFVEVLKVEPNDHLTKILLGHVYLEQNKITGALELFSEAARQRPDSAEAQHAYGVGLLKAGSVDDAIARFQHAIRINPSFAPAHRHLGEGFATKGKAADGIACYRKAIELRPNFPEALNDLAWLLSTHPDSAVRDGHEALKLATEACDLTRYQQPVPMTTLAAAYSELGRFEHATRMAERALALVKAANYAEYMHRAEAVLACAKDLRPYRQAN